MIPRACEERRNPITRLEFLRGGEEGRQFSWSGSLAPVSAPTKAASASRRHKRRILEASLRWRHFAAARVSQVTNDPQAESEPSSIFSWIHIVLSPPLLDSQKQKNLGDSSTSFPDR
jgi:hypothetical protein